MKACGPISTDETLRELAVHGSARFPFSCYHSTLGSGPCADVPWHWHREIEFVLVNAGVAHCMLGNERLTLSRGEGVFIHSGIIHSFASPQHAAITSVLFMPELIAPEQSDLLARFVAPFADEGRSHAALAPGVPWQADALAEIETLSSIVRHNAPTAELDVHAAVCRLWSGLFTHREDIGAMARAEHSALTQARLRRMIGYIEQNFAAKLTLADIAADASISKSEALRCFKNGVHTTPIDYLNRYRLHYARARLQATGAPVTEIAVESGFASTAYFDRMFRRCFAISPARYRKQRAGMPPPHDPA